MKRFASVLQEITKKKKSVVPNGCPMWYVEDADTNEILG